MSDKTPSLLDRAETVAKWELENSIPSEQRLTEWYGDYALYEPRLGVSEAQIMQKYRDITPRPQMELTGQDGNVFSIMGRASKLLKNIGQPDQADEMFKRATNCGSYDEALQIISEYVTTELSAPCGEVELSAAHLEQLDAVDNAVYQTILAFTKKTEDEFPWDMHYIGEVADAVESTLVGMGLRVYHPAIVTEKDGRQHIEEYQEPKPPETSLKTIIQKKKKENKSYER